MIFGIFRSGIESLQIMHPFSVVIVCKNEADVIGLTLQSLEGLSDDVLVYDNGSTDGTQDIVKSFPTRLVEGSWEGFGKTKRKALALARHDWVLFLDADEAPDEDLKKSLQEWQPAATPTVYEMAFRNYFMDKPLRYGEWGTDYHVRLFNRVQVNWDEAPVHEQLQLPPGTVTVRMKGLIRHRTLRSIESYKKKMEHYAELGAAKYYRQGKKAGWIKRRLSPIFSFFSSYMLRLGFLDGKEGYQSARITAWYTKMKYAKLRGLYRSRAPQH